MCSLVNVWRAVGSGEEVCDINLRPRTVWIGTETALWVRAWVHARSAEEGGIFMFVLWNFGRDCLNRFAKENRKIWFHSRGSTI